ncbi:hypothetical protein RFI_21650 [Reticulomyxa filosa]|uniref:Uncharacterized protein n=1 Tax=Reticulomyxa filosa TaxID=46433 RepID=X6MNY4_RETFI|nr:hypothetical protein RFI_21650 [Reticulomyxa filosa]|eukprot:ETO15713.1 hypothetical protein RFI_21650 [Reticulomyxa filosa]
MHNSNSCPQGYIPHVIYTPAPYTLLAPGISSTYNNNNNNNMTTKTTTATKTGPMSVFMTPVSATSPSHSNTNGNNNSNNNNNNNKYNDPLLWLNKQTSNASNYSTLSTHYSGSVSSLGPLRLSVSPGPVATGTVEDESKESHRLDGIVTSSTLLRSGTTSSNNNNNNNNNNNYSSAQGVSPMVIRQNSSDSFQSNTKSKTYELYDHSQSMLVSSSSSSSSSLSPSKKSCSESNSSTVTASARSSSSSSSSSSSRPVFTTSSPSLRFPAAFTFDSQLNLTRTRSGGGGVHSTPVVILD